MRNLVLLLLVLPILSSQFVSTAEGSPSKNHHKPRVGVFLYGAGVQDGSEIQEAVLTLLALEKAKAQVVVLAPDANQAEVVNHQTGKVVHEQRNMLSEAARISRGNVIALSEAKADELDAMIIPGGLGFIKSITSYAKDGINFDVDTALEQLLIELHNQKKPLGFICITPILAAKLFGSEHPRLTVGSNQDISTQVKSMGAQPVIATSKDAVVDKNTRIVSSPAYMVDSTIDQIEVGITKLVNNVVRIANHERKRSAAHREFSSPD